VLLLAGGVVLAAGMLRHRDWAERQKQISRFQRVRATIVAKSLSNVIAPPRDARRVRYNPREVDPF
jgi:hypothetical protein